MTPPPFVDPNLQTYPRRLPDLLQPSVAPSTCEKKSSHPLTHLNPFSRSTSSLPLLLFPNPSPTVYISTWMDGGWDAEMWKQRLGLLDGSGLLRKKWVEGACKGGALGCTYSATNPAVLPIVQDISPRHRGRGWLRAAKDTAGMRGLGSHDAWNGIREGGA